VLPQSILYRPVVLSETRYAQLNPVLGNLKVFVRCKDYNKTQGVNAYDMNAVEEEFYQAKVPLNDNGFEYPVRGVYIDVVKQEDDSLEIEYFARDILVNESNYNIEGGNLYFNKSIEALVSEKYPLFEDFLSQSWTSEMIDHTIFYSVRIVFDRFVPDTNDETRRLALAQATSYTIMDYFNQYKYAEISANMISEIAYTETLTFWSTLISAPMIYFGSWAVSATFGKMFGEAGAKVVMAGLQKSVTEGIKGMIIAPIKEVFDEIVKDSFIEALSEWIVDLAGGPEDLGFWLSSLLTSRREVSGALGQLAGVGRSHTFSSISNLISLVQAISSGDQEAIIAINHDLEQQQQANQLKQEQSSFWSKLLLANLLKGVFMTLPSVFLGSFSFVALAGLSKMVTSSIKLSPRAYAAFKTQHHNIRKEGKAIEQAVGTGSEFSIKSMVSDRLKRPSELEGMNIDQNNEFDEESGGSIPNLSNAIKLNPDPRKVQRSALWRKLSEISLVNSYRDTSFAVELFNVLYPDGYGGFKDPILSLNTWGMERGLGGEHLSFWGGLPNEYYVDTIKELRIEKKTDVKIDILNIGDDFEGLFPELDKDMVNYIHSKLFDPDYDQNKPEGVMDQIIYRSDLVLEAREFLKTTTYKGFWILKDGIINPLVLEVLQDKFSKGEEWSKLERIIADVASFYMGSMHNGESMPDGGYDSRLIKLYEEATGKEAFVNNLPTEPFKNWYDTKQVTLPRITQWDTLDKIKQIQIIEPTFQKQENLRQIIHDQLQHYSQTGERLFSSEEVQAESGFGYRAMVRYTNIILEEIFIDPESASLIYDMILGKITKSYQKIKEELIGHFIILKTTPTQWFDMLKNREGKSPSEMHVEVECIRKGHINLKPIGTVLGCPDCAYETILNRPLQFQDVLDLAAGHNVQAISFFDDSKPLSEDEFNKLVNDYNAQHQDSDNYKTGKLTYLNLKWKCLEYGHIFERNYANIRDSNIRNYCPTCISSIGQQITLEKAEDAFQGYIVQPFRSNEPLYKFLPKRTLLMPKYQAISNPRCHVDIYGVIYVAGKEFKIAIEYQGAQHYSLIAYTNLARSQDIKRNIYKTDAEYEIEYNAQLERDKTKVKMFEDLNKDGYYLIVVPYKISPAKRKSFILQEFIKQTGVNPGQASIFDYL